MFEMFVPIAMCSMILLQRGLFVKALLCLRG